MKPRHLGPEFGATNLTENKEGVNRLVEEINRGLFSNGEASDFAASVADLTLAELLSDEVLENIPVVSWITKAKRVYTSISDRLFLAKTAAFIIQLSKNPVERDSKFARRLSTNPKQAQRFSETILFLLSKLDATQKAAVVAELCKLLLQGRIEVPQFRRLCHITDVMFVDDLLEHGRALKSISNATLDDEFRMLERYGLAIISEGGSRVYNDKTQKMDQCYDAHYTDDGARLNEAVWETLQGGKSC